MRVPSLAGAVAAVLLVCGLVAQRATEVGRLRAQSALEQRLGFRPGLEQRVRAHLAEAIARRVFPGAVALVAKDGVVVVETAIGNRTYTQSYPIAGVPGARSEALPVQVGDRFDMASLTKVCATTPAVLRLLARSELSLDTKVVSILPGFRDDRNREVGAKPPVPGKAKVTIRHLLTHSAGLIPFEQFFKRMDDRAAVLDACLTSPLRSKPGTRKAYSDIGLILLMACVERITGKPFANVVQREVFDPLGMERATFAPRGQPIDAVPTEVSTIQKGVLRGQVHDENAFALGGVSGHAGLFATARDVFRLGQAFLDRGARPGGTRWLARTWADRAIRRDGLVPGSSRGLGWDTFMPGGSSGTRMAKTSFGHTGFTGTSIWCDPTRALCVVLLTNRVHPSRANSRITPVRGGLADLVVDSLQ